MKYLLLLLLTLFILPLATQAQDIAIDPALQQVVSDALPAKYASYGTALILGIMILGRGLTALANGRGIKGWLSAIINGTNTPLRILLSALCLLTLPACSVDWKKLGMQVGQATADAALPIITDTIVTKPKAAKQPVNVKP